MVKVYVRDFETRSIVKAIDVSNVVGTSNYDRFFRGLIHNMDLEHYFVDETEVDNLNKKNKGGGS